MSTFGENTSATKTFAPLIALDVLYDGMPSTTGCDKCEDVNGDDAIWCCRMQSPSLFYVEFIKACLEVQTWSKEKKAGLIIRAIKAYLSSDMQKGCVCYDQGCTVYLSRPIACRQYGVIPEENWKKRWEQLEDREGKNFTSKPQCNLVSTVSGKGVTVDQDERWFAHVRKQELRIGMPEHIVNLHDKDGGTYRTFHDHLLLEMFSSETLETLTKVKLSKPSKDIIENTAEAMRQELIKSGVL